LKFPGGTSRIAVMIVLNLGRAAAICMSARKIALSLGWLALALLPGVLRAAPELSLPDLHGVIHHLSDYRGKWVLVNYWATWCPPCLQEMPELEIFYATHKDKDAVVLGVNTETISTEALGRFVDEQSLTYPILRGDEGGQSPFGPIVGLPTSVLVGPQGKAVARQEGPVTAQAIEAFIARHADQTPNSPP